MTFQEQFDAAVVQHLNELPTRITVEQIWGEEIKVRDPHPVGDYEFNHRNVLLTL